MATILTRSFGEQGNQRKFTISVWVKRCNLAAYNTIFSSGSGAYATRIYFDGSTAQLDWWNYFNSAYQGRKTSNAKYRDINGYYHIVCRYDSASSTASERMRMYINGEQVTSLATSSNPNQNQTQEVGHTGTHYIGGYNNSADFDGLMSHYHYCDNYSYAPTEFGETDSTTGEWKIKTSPSVSYGTTGFFILKDGNSVTDQSGLSHNWTVGSGTLTKTEDSPSNVFATMNALNPLTSAITYSNGNNTVSYPGAWVFALGNTGVSSGKYYWEAKCNSGNNANSYFGICAEMVPAGNGFYNNSQNGAIMYKVGGGETYIDGSYNSSGYSPAINDTDTVGLALDLDSGTKTLKIYKNGTLLSSGGTINLSSYYNDTLVFPCFSGNSSSASCSFNVNFGNGTFGTSSVSSAGTNASGNGIFEYDVPANHTAISTKGLNL